MLLSYAYERSCFKYMLLADAMIQAARCYCTVLRVVQVCGHLLAYPFVANIVEWDNAANASVANGALLDLARYITSNGYRLIDITGNVTTWGHWDPPALNGDRSLSDVRGLNSIQMLALLAAGLKAAPNASDPDNILFTAAWEDLRKAGYVENMLNAKIATVSCMLRLMVA